MFSAIFSLLLLSLGVCSFFVSALRVSGVLLAAEGLLCLWAECPA